MRRRTLVAIVAGAVVVVLVGVGVIWWTLGRTPDARDTADRYLAALASGDIGAVMAVQDAASDADAQQTLVAAFSGATEYVADPRVEDLALDGDRSASVRASAQLGGERRTIRFALALGDDGWKLSGDYLGSVTVTTTIGDSVWIGDALVPVGAPVGLLPARYRIAPAPRAVLDGDATVAVDDDEPLAVALTPTVSADGVSIAQQQLEIYQDDCTRPAAAVPDSCGLRVPWAADLATLTGIAWRIEQRPALALAPDARTFAATGGVVVATATGLTRDGATESFTYRADDWALRGVVRFSGDAMTLAVD